MVDCLLVALSLGNFFVSTLGVIDFLVTLTLGNGGLSPVIGDFALEWSDDNVIPVTAILMGRGLRGVATGLDLDCVNDGPVLDWLMEL